MEILDAIHDCHKHSVEYLETYGATHDLTGPDHQPLDHVVEHAGAMAGCLVGKGIRYVQHIINAVPVNNIIHPDTSEIIVKDTINNTTTTIKLTTEDVRHINQQCIVRFNKINKQMIVAANESLNELDRLSDNEQQIVVSIDKYVLMNPVDTELTLQNYLSVVQSKTSEYYGSVDAGYKQRHNVLPPPTITEVQWGGPVRGSGKLGDFIMMIPVLTVSCGSGGGSGGCCIL